MKLTLIFLVLLVVFVAYLEAQNCRGKPRLHNCAGGGSIGRGGRRCRRNSNRYMWYFNSHSRQCVTLHYLGCGGNANRFCSKASCERSCPVLAG
ncbi:kunitz-type serine protease inhibitor A-like [Teleopsis dalmanni]|uniref:kunitz-type serine protease inhibitor A-like n=1 Tax=Teleopsis dalmanni TaxID=139649 RepID=UPI0018CC943D|nr:kunitz-type serine protease inhibitor A-like [Teleopsis dalmanni]